MPPNSLLGRRTRSEVNDGRTRSGSPTTTSPTTRKRQRVEGFYRDLNSGRRSTTPIDLTTSQTSQNPPSPTPSPRRSPRNARRAPPPRIDPRTDCLEERSLFLPEREPLLQAPSRSIRVNHNTNEESGIQKTAWWWVYFTVQILDNLFHRGKKKEGKAIHDERWTCKFSQTCKFYRLASHCQTATTALSDHIKLHHKLTEKHDSERVLRGQRTTQEDITAFLRPETYAAPPTFIDALLDWITHTNKPFVVTENPWFLRMLKAAGYSVTIPKGDTIKAKLMARMEVIKAQIKADLKATSSTVSLTLDAWTSNNKKPMLAINVHWLDEEFVKRSHCLEFVEIKGSHSGETLASYVFATLQEFGLCEKLLTITGDNASNNPMLCHLLLQRLLEEHDDYLAPVQTMGQTIRFQGSKSMIRCFAHILNLIVKAILIKLGASTLKNANQLLDLAASTPRQPLMLPLGQAVVATLRIIILWIHRSPQRIQEWHTQRGVTKLPNYDVDTRWNFTLQMIDDAFKVKPFLMRFCETHHELSQCKLYNADWETLEKIQLILRPFKKFTEFVSRDQPSIQLVGAMFTDLGILLKKIIAKQGEFARLDRDLLAAVEEGEKVFKKYFDHLKDSDFYYLATVLDPRVKTEWIKQNLRDPDEVIRRVRDLLKATYLPLDSQLPDNSQDEYQTLEYQFLLPFLGASQDSNDSDIDQYLDSPPVRYKPNPKDNQTQWILDWWKANRTQYGCMARAAREYLAVPSSEVDCERLFNTGRDLLGVRRWSMSGDTMRVMMLLKGAMGSLQGIVIEGEGPTTLSV